MEFDSVWDIVISRKNNALITEMEERVILVNCFNEKEYCLTHSIEGSTHSFFGCDSENNKCNIKLFTFASFDEVKSAYKNLTLLQNSEKALSLIKINDIFEVFDGIWMLVVICEYLEGLNLAELDENIHNLSIPKEIGIFTYIKLLDIIEAADKAGIILNILPDTVLIIKQESEVDAIYCSYDTSYALKIITNRQILSYGKMKYECLSNKRNSIEKESWGASLCLYVFYGPKHLSELGCLKDLDEKEITEFMTVPDPAVNTVIAQAMKFTRFSTLVSHINIRTWKLFYASAWDSVEELRLKDITPLLTILRFENNKLVILAAKKILHMAADYSADILKVLVAVDFFNEFFRIMKRVDFSNSPKMMNALFLVIRGRILSMKTKSSLISAGFLGMIEEGVNINASSDSIALISTTFFENNTFTLLQILWDSDFIDKILEKPIRSKHEIEFLTSTMSYYGPHSLDLIVKVKELLDINTFRTLQNIYEIPYRFKIKKIPELFALLNSLYSTIKCSSNEEAVEIIKILILIVVEVLCLPSYLQKQHIRGDCTSHSQQSLLTYFGKNPLMVNCVECGFKYCIMCYEKFHIKHETAFLLQESSMFICHTSNMGSPYNFFDFKLPVYSSELSFVNIFETPYDFQERSHIIGLTQTTLLSSTSLNPHFHQHSENTAEAYFEIYLSKAGIYENICIGISGTGVIYYGSTGHIYRNGHFVSAGPRFGSYDTIGAGLFQGKVFFTLNGLLLRPMIECSVMQPVRAMITIDSGYVEIQVKFNEWMFNTTPPESYESEPANTLLDSMKKKIVKLCCRKDSRNDDLFDKYIELLEILNKSETAEALRQMRAKISRPN